MKTTTALLALLPALSLTSALAVSNHHQRPRGASHAFVKKGAEDASLVKKEHQHAISRNRIAEAVQQRDGGKKQKKRACKVQTTSTSAPSSTSSAPASSSSSSGSGSGANANVNLAAASSSPAATGAATTTASATTTATASKSTSSLTPNGIKAGISAGDAYSYVENYIGWWYDWSPAPSGHTGTPLAVPMLWGDGQVDSTDASRYAAFQALADTPAPPFIIGFEEPDCSTAGSANIDVSTAASVWDSLMAPHGQAGSLLLSPSMCHQADETWLTPFEQAISYPWDITNLHINKNSMSGVQEDLDYYYNKYGKPMWVTEFACVDDSNGFTPCTDQDEINTFINDIVALFQSDSRVYAYAYSDGEGLSDAWMLTDSSGALSASGTTYLNAIKQYA